MKKNWIKISFILVFVAAIFLPVAFAHADSCSSFQQLFNIKSSNLTSGRTVDQTNPTSQVKVFCSAGEIFTYILNLLFGFTGAVAVIFIIIGGFWFMTSAGNEERAEKGRKTLINSIIGLVVIILAATIVRIVVNTLTGGSSGGGTTTSTTSSGSGNNTSGGSTAGSGGSTSGGGSANVMNDVSVLVVPPNSSNPDVYQFNATIPSSDAEALATFCNSSFQPFDVILQKNPARSTSSFSANGNNSALTATVTILKSSITTVPDTAVYYLCGQKILFTGTVPAGFGN